MLQNRLILYYGDEFWLLPFLKGNKYPIIHHTILIDEQLVYETNWLLLIAATDGPVISFNKGILYPLTCTLSQLIACIWIKNVGKFLCAYKYTIIMIMTA